MGRLDAYELISPPVSALTEVILKDSPISVLILCEMLSQFKMEPIKLITL